jgi:hypothetical protein
MKLTTTTQVSVDGVMQGNGGASEEDRRNGFERGGWAMGLFNSETMTFINQTYQRADAFLFASGPTRSSPPTGARWIRAAAPSQTP